MLLIAERIKQSGTTYLSRVMVELESFRLFISEQYSALAEVMRQNDVTEKCTQQLPYHQPKQLKQLLSFIQRAANREWLEANKQEMSAWALEYAQQVIGFFDSPINEPSAVHLSSTGLSLRLNQALSSVLSDASMGDWFIALSVAVAKSDLLQSLGGITQFSQLGHLWMARLSCLLSGSREMGEALDSSLVEQSISLFCDGLINIGTAKQQKLMEGWIGRMVVTAMQDCLPDQSLSDLGYDFWQLLDVINHPLNESSGNHVLARAQSLTEHCLVRSKALVENAFAQAKEHMVVGQSKQSDSYVLPIVTAIARHYSQKCTNILNTLHDMNLDLDKRLLSWSRWMNYILSLTGEHNTIGLYLLKLSYGLRLLQSQSNHVNNQISSLSEHISDDWLSPSLMQDVWAQLRSQLREDSTISTTGTIESLLKQVVASPPEQATHSVEKSAAPEEEDRLSDAKIKQHDQRLPSISDTPDALPRQQNMQRAAAVESAPGLSVAFKQLELKAVQILDKWSDSPGWSRHLLFALVDSAFGPAGVKQLNHVLEIPRLMAKLMLVVESSRQTIVQGQQPWAVACADLTEQCSHVLQEAGIMLTASSTSSAPARQEPASTKKTVALLAYIAEGSSAIQSGMSLLRKVTQWLDKNLPIFSSKNAFIREAMHYINSFEHLRSSLPAPLERAIQSAYQDIVETIHLLDQKMLNQEQVIDRILSILKNMMTFAYHQLSEHFPPSLLRLAQQLGEKWGVSVESGFEVMRQGLHAALPAPVTTESEKLLEPSSTEAAVSRNRPTLTDDEQNNLDIAAVHQPARLPVDSKLVGLACLGMQGLVAAGLMMQRPSSLSSKRNALLTQLEGLPEQELICLSCLCVAAQIATVLAGLVGFCWMQTNKIRSALPQNAILANATAGLMNAGGGTAVLALTVVALPVVTAASVFMLQVFPTVMLQTKRFASAVENKQPRQALAAGKGIASAITKGAIAVVTTAVITALALTVLGTALILTSIIKGPTWIKQADDRSNRKRLQRPQCEKPRQKPRSLFPKILSLFSSVSNSTKKENNLPAIPNKSI